MGEFLTKDFNVFFESYINGGNKGYTSLFIDLKKKYNNKNYALCLNYIILNYNDTDLLNHALKEINKIRHEENFGALIDFLAISNEENSFANLKVLAIKILAAYKNEKALQPLLNCLNNKSSSYKIRLAAAEALGKIGNKTAYESLMNVARDEKEKSVYVRESAVVALGLLGDNRALDVFNSIINSSQMFLDKFSYFKEKIVEAIAKLDITNENKALDILKTSLKDKSSSLRISSIETLMNLELKESFALIRERLDNDPDIEVRKNALIALYNISDRKILDEIINGDFPKELKDCADEIIKEYEDNDDE